MKISAYLASSKAYIGLIVVGNIANNRLRNLLTGIVDQDVIEGA